MIYDISPGKSLSSALSKLRPGDTLIVHEGTYEERVRPTLVAGTPTAPIVVKKADNERRPVVKGLFWLRAANYWVIDGIDVTWGTSNTKSEHMVKLQDCIGTKLLNGELYGARSYAGLLIAGASSNWVVQGCHVHDTYPYNDVNQDHLIYVNSPGPGRIERCLLVNSPNGRGVKVGPSSSTSTPLGNVAIRYNTFDNNTGPSNVQLSYSASNCVIENNIFQKPSKECVTAYKLNGKGNVVRNNVGWQATKVMAPTAGFVDGGGNVLIDPKFNDIYCPQNTAVQSYGLWAPPV